MRHRQYAKLIVHSENDLLASYSQSPFASATAAPLNVQHTEVGGQPSDALTDGLACLGWQSGQLSLGTRRHFHTPGHQGSGKRRASATSQGVPSPRAISVFSSSMA